MCQTWGFPLYSVLRVAISDLHRPHLMYRSAGPEGSSSISLMIIRICGGVSPIRNPQEGHASRIRLLRFAPWSWQVFRGSCVIWYLLHLLHKKRAGVRRTFLFLLYSGPVVAQTAPVAQSVKRFAAQLQLSSQSEKLALACLSPDRRYNIARTWGTPPRYFPLHPSNL